jgi:hypothetical protein
MAESGTVVAVAQLALAVGEPEPKLARLFYEGSDG